MFLKTKGFFEMRIPVESEENIALINQIADSIEQQLFLAFDEKMDFFMITAPSGRDVRKCRYIGNIKPRDAVPWMAEFISHLSKTGDEDFLFSAIADIVLNLATHGRKKELIEYLEHIISELKKL